MPEEHRAGLNQILELNNPPIDLMEPRGFFLDPVIERGAATGEPTGVLQDLIHAHLATGDKLLQPVAKRIGRDVVGSPAARGEDQHPHQASFSLLNGKPRALISRTTSCTKPTIPRPTARARPGPDPSRGEFS